MSDAIANTLTTTSNYCDLSREVGGLGEGELMGAELISLTAKVLGQSVLVKC